MTRTDTRRTAASGKPIGSHNGTPTEWHMPGPKAGKRTVGHHECHTPKSVPVVAALRPVVAEPRPVVAEPSTHGSYFESWFVRLLASCNIDASGTVAAVQARLERLCSTDKARLLRAMRRNGEFAPIKREHSLGLRRPSIA